MDVNWDDSKLQFVIKPQKDKAPLSEANEYSSGFPWTSQSILSKLPGTKVILAKGVYIDDQDDLNSLFWLLQQGAHVKVENPWCVGETAVRLLAKNTEVYPGKCYLGELTVGGYSGMGITEAVRAWAKKHELPPESRI